MPRMEGVVQQSPEWLAARATCATASRVADVMRKLKRKDGEAADRLNYKRELVWENLTGLTFESYVSPAMEWGIQNEVMARVAYEDAHGIEVEDGGFFLHDKIERFGASPDGLVGEDGLIEIKCPTPMVHLETLLTGEIPEDYQWQMLAEMDCANRQWCDYVSYDPRMPKHLKLFEKRFPRDEVRIAEMRAEVCQFQLEVLEIVKRLKP
jgi:putative phage-type endonuclease